MGKPQDLAGVTFLAVLSKHSSLADGTIRVTFDLQEGEDRAFASLLQLRNHYLQVAAIPVADSPEDMDG